MWQRRKGIVKADSVKSDFDKRGAGKTLGWAAVLHSTNSLQL